MLPKLSLCVPTINRSHYLKRALTYYSAVNFDGKILIGDSSDSHHKKTPLATAKNYCNDHASITQFDTCGYFLASVLRCFIHTLFG